MFDVCKDWIAVYRGVPMREECCPQESTDVTSAPWTVYQTHPARPPVWFGMLFHAHRRNDIALVSMPPLAELMSSMRQLRFGDFCRSSRVHYDERYVIWEFAVANSHCVVEINLWWMISERQPLDELRSIDAPLIDILMKYPQKLLHVETLLHSCVVAHVDDRTQMLKLLPMLPKLRYATARRSRMATMNVIDPKFGFSGSVPYLTVDSIR